MKRLWILIAVLLLCVIIVVLFAHAREMALAAEPPPDMVAQEEMINAAEMAVMLEVNREREFNLGFLVNNSEVEGTTISEDGQWAISWIVLYDAETGAVLPIEPGLAISHYDGKAWQASLPSYREWPELLQDAPADLVDDELRETWMGLYETYEQQTTTAAPLTGYLLPWRAGQTVYLSQSVLHDKYTPSGNAHYAFDFYISGKMWNIQAAKSGTVWMWKDNVPNGDDSGVGNYIVLQDTTTTPTSYQLYLHLAQDSIPEDLKEVGVPVVRGQFIGIVDDTGQSTGHHLHFHVHTYAGYYWGRSVDIVFGDVDINGGRPRVHDAQLDDFPYCWESDVCITGRRNYVSQNWPPGDIIPPEGELAGVTMGATVTTGSITLSGRGWDDNSGLDYGEVIASYDGSWHTVGEPFAESFVMTWDLCNPALPIPDGPVSVALRLFDQDQNVNNLAGLTHFIKDYACPAPPVSCIPSADQVSLFEDANYSGNCVLYDIGDYANAGAIGDNDAASLLVGANVLVTLYSETDHTGHSQTFSASDSDLHGDIVGVDVLSSMRVARSNAAPLVPDLITSASTQFTAGDLVPLAWVDGGGALEYQVQYSKDGGAEVKLEWQKSPSVWLSNLLQGSYAWKVCARNGAGTVCSTTATFSMTAMGALPAAVNTPFQDTMETDTNWSESGLWRWKNDSGASYNGSHAWWYQGTDADYDDGKANWGFLTSVPINITASNRYLRFWYQYESETHDKHWDQRWLQISVNGDPFINLLQFGDDPYHTEMADANKNDWMQSPVVDLSAYAGSAVRIRFAFATLDPSMNVFDGWGIDNVVINNTPATTCSDLRQDETPQQAYALNYNTSATVAAEICPGGDYDYYKFTGSAGDRVVIDIDAQSNGSVLDAYAILLAGDGKTILVENDDQIFAQLRDPLLSLTLPQNGTYYIQVRAWKHPQVGDDDQDYTIRLYKDTGKPQAALVYPLTAAYLPDSSFDVTLNVQDDPDGIAQVAFYWHDSNWQDPTWELRGTDYDGEDGWSYSFDLAGEPEGFGNAVYIQVMDKAGRIAGISAWNLVLDKTAPVTILEPFPNPLPSNALQLTWSGYDNLSGLKYVNVQYSLNNGATWVDFDESIPGYVFDGWFVASPEQKVSFRMQGVDHSLNIESYPTEAEVTAAVPGAGVLCSSLDVYDTNGNDNTPATASVYVVKELAQRHNFCNPLAADFSADVDWISFYVVKGEFYLIRTKPLSPVTAPTLGIYAYNGETATLLAESVATTFGEPNDLAWVADRTGVIYLRVTHMDSTVIGSGVSYDLWVRNGYEIFMPWIVQSFK
ncbi:MAG: peptidoglycan DD-metalloendopeptidase family protein [Anaerolineales bacterium]|nr:peptidoglycan DD-metalloendopeptidase family protein [Anaerolineales bacterium]